MSAAVLEYGDWLSKLLTQRVEGLEKYQQLFDLLTNGEEVIKVFCEVATDARLHD